MPLTGKYLKFSPEITLEIFTLVFNKLIKSGLKEYSNKTIVKSYSQFSKEYKCLTYTGEQHFNTHINPFAPSLSETTVQEILGYDPFLVKEVIPEYVELLSGFDNTRTGKIFDTKNVIPLMNDWNSLWTWESIFKNDLQRSYFKPSTKEAFDTQNKPKQPLKQAVHCKTQEEWNFITEKLGYKWAQHCSFSAFSESTCISLIDTQYSYVDYLKNDYQILSFQEWCNLNGYKMEKEVEFKVGRWYKNPNWGNPDKDFIKYSYISGNYICGSERIRYEKHLYESTEWGAKNQCTLASIEEIQQYLPDGHPDKIKVDREFKIGDFVISLDKSSNYIVDEFCIISKISKTHLACKNKPQDGWSMKPFRNFRFATPEEINNYLISIGQIPAEPICTNTNSNRHDGCGEKYGCIQNCDECDYYQIPAGEPLNNGIEPNKDGMFKYKQTMPGASWSGGTIDNHLDVMIQSKTQSEIEFNYLPEPK